MQLDESDKNTVIMTKCVFRRPFYRNIFLRNKAEGNMMRSANFFLIRKQKTDIFIHCIALMSFPVFTVCFSAVFLLGINLTTTVYLSREKLRKSKVAQVWPNSRHSFFCSYHISIRNVCYKAAEMSRKLHR